MENGALSCVYTVWIAKYTNYKKRANKKNLCVMIERVSPQSAPNHTQISVYFLYTWTDFGSERDGGGENLLGTMARTHTLQSLSGENRQRSHFFLLPHSYNICQRDMPHIACRVRCRRKADETICCALNKITPERHRVMYTDAAAATAGPPSQPAKCKRTHSYTQVFIQHTHTNKYMRVCVCVSAAKQHHMWKVSFGKTLFG